jgi:hypothetical protein
VDHFLFCFLVLTSCRAHSITLCHRNLFYSGKHWDAFECANCSTP